MNKIDRIRAEEAIWQLQTMASVTSAEAYKSGLEDLKRMVGTIYLREPSSSTLEMLGDNPDPEFDRSGLLDLKESFTW